MSVSAHDAALLYIKVAVNGRGARSPLIERVTLPKLSCVPDSKLPSRGQGKLRINRALAASTRFQRKSDPVSRLNRETAPELN